MADAPESYESVEVTTFAGIYPELPDRVNAVFAGGLTMELEVQWDKVTLDQYSREGEFTVEGRVAGLKQTCTAAVKVIGELGDGKTVKESVAAKDAYTQEADGDKAYGKSDPNVIKVKTANNAPSYTRRGVIGFDLSEEADMLKSATNITIKLQMTRPSSEDDYKKINNHFYLKVYEVGNEWKEDEVTWNSTPDFSADNLVINDKKIVYTDIRDNHEDIVELDVTDWVKKAYAKNGQTSFSFLMVTDYFGEYTTGDNGGIDFASKEAAGKMAPTIVLSNVYETKVEAVSVSTPAGKKPVLPETVTVTYSNEETKNVTVEWNSINPASYQTEGTFVVYGKADGINLPIACTVNVMEALHKVVKVKDFAGIIQLVGTPWEELGLPEMAAVLLDNGQEAEVGIQYWFPDNAYDPDKEFSYTCIGYLDLTNHDSIENPDQKFATVSVSIIEPEDKNALLVLYTEAAELINSGEAAKLTESAKSRFMKAFNKAAEVLVNTKATELEVHTAYTELLEAIWSMDSEENQKADTDALRDLVLIAESKKKKDYTEETYEAMKEALSEAKAVLRDKTLTKADQPVVDMAYENLKEAVDALEYSGKTDPVTKVMTGIKITSLPTKIEYKTGERFSSAGLVVAAVYSDGSTKTISGYEIGDVDTGTAGTKDVAVTYRVAVNDAIKVFTDTFQITVVKKSSSGSSTGSSSGSSSGSVKVNRAPVNVSGQWQKAENDIWKFQKSDGSYAKNEWARINDKWYHFDGNSHMQTGWILDGDKWYKLGSDGSMHTGWVKEETDGQWYYLDESGAMMTGWVFVNGKWYYLNPVTQGNTGWQNAEDGKWNRGSAESGSRSVGSLYTGTTTPDGYQVDENGAWIQ